MTDTQTTDYPRKSVFGEGRGEKYPLPTLEVNHALFIPKRSLRRLHSTVQGYEKRHNMQFRMASVAMNGSEGVLVWRIK